MSTMTVMFDTDDPELRPMLAEIGRMPRSAERLRVEAGLCQWWANRCLEEAGRQEGRARAFDYNRRPKSQEGPQSEG